MTLDDFDKFFKAREEAMPQLLAETQAAADDLKMKRARILAQINAKSSSNLTLRNDIDEFWQQKEDEIDRIILSDPVVTEHRPKYYRPLSDAEVVAEMKALIKAGVFEIIDGQLWSANLSDDEARRRISMASTLKGDWLGPVRK